ncbi:hypothetical protein AVEN_54102-1 [Araneus ventricosus]|uniref:ZP domain-containing protein n=1 Tax=Araneus ventricosus TaxID=182803 RepID=A0A4Y2BU80_ARAVE|nr:hypothetical protein AVEN_54102-1 [Araneus ventricosus]
MEIFGFKARKVYGCFELKYVTLLMVLIPCAWTRYDIPSFNVTCDSTGLFVKIAFSKPFNGTVYAKGYRFDPLCSMSKSSVLDGSLALPLTACGTYVQETNNPWITNTVVIQQHPLIRTVNDLEKSVICSLPHPFENFWDSTLLLDQIYESHSLPLTKSSSDIHLESDVFQEDSATIFDYSFTRLIIFQLLNGSIYNDVGIESCIAHNALVLAGNASVHQITNPEGCFTIDSENSNLTIIGTDEGLTAYVEMKNLEMESSDSLYLTCEVILCKTKCRCSEIDQQQTEHSTTVISHKLTKRSTDTSSEMFSLKQYETRTRYLKSTVKALMDRIVEQRNQNDKSKIRKRLMRLDDSSILSEANSFGSRAITTSTEIFSPESVSTEFYNIEPHLVDVYDDYDPDDSHQDYDSHHDYDPDDSHHDYKEEPSPTTEFSTVDSDMVVVTLPKEFKDNGTETVSDEELQGKGTIVLSDDVVSSVNESTENIKTVTTTSSVFSPTVEVASDHLGSCIPRLRFVIVIVAMGFFIGCLLMVSCGMALYIRKEKKRNRLNDFLLYSIGF